MVYKTEVFYYVFTKSKNFNAVIHDSIQDERNACNPEEMS